MTQDKEFGIFVGLYNAVNNTKYSVKKAKTDKVVWDLFLDSKSRIEVTKPQINTSTKRSSYNQLNIPKVDLQVLTSIKNNPNISRYLLAKDVGKRLSTVCGAVRRLLDADLILVSGAIVDPETNRKVESLIVK